jgi:xylose isomerase
MAERYARWSDPLGTAILDGRETLASLEGRVASGEIDPKPVTGRQEELENAVNQVLWTADQGARVGSSSR